MAHAPMPRARSLPPDVARDPFQAQRQRLASPLARLAACFLDGATAAASAAVFGYLGSEFAGSLAWFAAYLYLMVEYGQTPGKALMGLQIVRGDGRPVGFLRGAIVRTLAFPLLLVAIVAIVARFSPNMLASLGEDGLRGLFAGLIVISYLTIFGRNRRTFNDYLAGTHVVRVS